MSEKTQYGFFLGANSYNGFTSLYEEYLFSGDIERIYILKDGLGCCKSTFLRIAADIITSEGYEINYIYCTEDPDLLDGIEIPALKTALIDGASPHILEPEYAGERDFYIDLSRFYLNGTSGLRSVIDGNREKYSMAYKFLKAAGDVNETLNISIPGEAKDIINRRAKGIINRELKKTGRKHGKITRIFTDAFTYKGLVSLNDTLSIRCKKLISLDNTCGAANYLLEPISEAAVNRGYDIIIGLSPFTPDDICHLLIPELSLGFVSARIGRRLHLDKTVFDCMNAVERQSFKETYALREQIMSKAQNELKAAKVFRDKLAAKVNAYMDYNGAETFAIQFIRDIILG